MVWALEFISMISDAFTISTIGSLYIGLCLYIGSMVTDLKTQMASIDRLTSNDGNEQVQFQEIRTVYLQALKFHLEVIE